MIKGNQIVYQRSGALLSSLEAQSPIAYAFVIAIFSTILSYQISTLLTDLLLGIKRKGEAKQSDIGSLLVAQEGSAQAVLKNLRSNPNHKRFLLWSRTTPDVYQAQNRARPSVIGKLLLLVAVAPIINLAAIAVAVERSQELSFKQAGFGGLALGINEDFTWVRFGRAADMCHEYRIQVLHLDTQVALVMLCKELELRYNLAAVAFSTESDVTIRIEVGTPGVISISMENVEMYTWHHFINIAVNGRVYRLQQRFTLTDAKKLMNMAEKVVMEQMCVAEYNPAKVKEEQTVNGSLFNLATIFVRCNDPTWFINDPDNEFTAAFTQIRFPLTIINSERMFVAPEVDSEKEIQESQFFEADNLPAIRRKGSMVSGGWLGIAAAVSIVLRVLVRFITNNDVEDGIELLVKDQLGLDRYDSMLQSKKWAQYQCSKSREIGNGEGVQDDGGDAPQ